MSETRKELKCPNCGSTSISGFNQAGCESRSQPLCFECLDCGLNVGKERFEVSDEDPRGNLQPEE